MQAQRQQDSGLQAVWSQGLLLHQAGRLDEARRCYEALLAVDPRHFDALHMLGVSYIQTGHAGRGADLIGQAVQARPDVADAHGNLANALNALGRHDQALAAADRAIALNPAYAEAHGNRGRALYALRRPAEALESYGRVIALKPAAKAYLNQGAVLRDLGRLDEAIASYDRAIALQPGFADALCGRGVALRERGRPEDALHSLDPALALRPDDAEAHFNRAIALRELGRPLEALDGYDRALALRPAHAEAWSNRGNVLGDLKRHEAALDSYDRALALQPDYAEAWSNRMVALRALRRPDEALASAERAVALAPQSAEAWNNLGGALYEFQRLDAVLDSHERAIALKPGYAEAWTNRGVALHQMRRLDEAMESYDRALALKPDYAEAQHAQSLTRLTLGDYAKGWPQYEWRWRTAQFEKAVRDLGAPPWLGGEDLAGRSILLHAEQGLGDALQFCRYVPRVTALGARVTLEAHAGLERLMTRLPGAARIVTRGHPLPPCDFQAPLMSLPLALGAAPEDDNAPYLSPELDDAAAWAARLGAVDGDLRVGLVWAGGSRPDQPLAHAIDQRRSLPLEALAPLAGIHGVRFYSLQKGGPAAQLAKAAQQGWNGPAITDFTSQIKDFADTAALVANLDLVIACDTSTAHLAGAMGKPVWILNRFDACWRWLDGRADSPWYPSARLYRQETTGDWAGVIQAVKRDLISRSL